MRPVITWGEFITHPDSETVISVGTALSSLSHHDIYNVTSPGDGEYNLAIRLDGKSGGTYRCQQLMPVNINTYVHVIVLGEWVAIYRQHFLEHNCLFRELLCWVFPPVI